jgi:hypothetical protein
VRARGAGITARPSRPLAVNEDSTGRNIIVPDPSGHVRSSHTDLSNDNCGAVTTRKELVASFPEDALRGAEAFSPIKAVYHFARVPISGIDRGFARRSDTTDARFAQSPGQYDRSSIDLGEEAAILAAVTS